jgi:aerobic carbon-monoxide dehydrogenase medium subunit
MKLPAFDYRCPTTLEDAIAILSADAGSKVLAGGQSLLPMMAFRLAGPTVLVDLNRIEGLDRITIDEAGVSLGAMVRWRDIEDDKRLRASHPLLVAAVEHIAHYQIRNRGTIGGSLAHADPAAELPGIAVTCDAEIKITGPEGSRLVGAEDFFEAPLTTCLAQDEIVESMHLPPWPPQRRWAFDEFAQRRGDFAFAGVALFYDETDDGAAMNVHVGVIGASPVPRRLRAAEQVIEGRLPNDTLIAEAARMAAASVEPDDDIHASAAYRRALVGTLVERTLVAAAARARP